MSIEFVYWEVKTCWLFSQVIPRNSMKTKLKNNLIILENEEDFLPKPVRLTKVVLESEVRPLTEEQKNVLFAVTIVVVFFAVVGNFLVIYVNLSR